MKTRYLQFNKKDMALAGELIRRGELVAFPTETVYGLGANAFDEQAVKNTYLAKGRPSDNPLIVHIWDKSQVFDIAREVSQDALKVIENVMPAPITIVLPKKDVIGDSITAGLDTVAVRMPLSVQAREFLHSASVPVTAPSANLSGRPSPTTWQRVAEDMDGRISAVLCGDDCAVGIESTVLDLSRDEPVILRPGAVGAKQLSELLGKQVKILTDPNSKVNSPGVRYKHYAPNVPMVLDLSEDATKLAEFYDAKVKEGYHPVLWVRFPERFSGKNVYPMGTKIDDAAHGLYEHMRILERTYDFIIASVCPSDEGLGVGVLDKLVRASGHNLI